MTASGKEQGDIWKGVAVCRFLPRPQRGEDNPRIEFLFERDDARTEAIRKWLLDRMVLSPDQAEDPIATGVMLNPKVPKLGRVAFAERPETMPALLLLEEQQRVHVFTPREIAEQIPELTEALAPPENVDVSDQYL